MAGSRGVERAGPRQKISKMPGELVNQGQITCPSGGRRQRHDPESSGKSTNQVEQAWNGGGGSPLQVIQSNDGWQQEDHPTQQAVPQEVHPDILNPKKPVGPFTRSSGDATCTTPGKATCTTPVGITCTTPGNATTSTSPQQPVQGTTAESDVPSTITSKTSGDADTRATSPTAVQGTNARHDIPVASPSQPADAAIVAPVYMTPAATFQALVTPASPYQPASAQTNYAQQPSMELRRSGRGNKGVTRRYEDFAMGSELDKVSTVYMQPTPVYYTSPAYLGQQPAGVYSINPPYMVRLCA